jgi:hypothetical protein
MGKEVVGETFDEPSRNIAQIVCASVGDPKSGLIKFNGIQFGEGSEQANYKQLWSVKTSLTRILTEFRGRLTK